ncbi:MAG: MATE family efflux transporter [Sphingobacteriia bacterium]|nr:MATE family efflux transporter [Sphingobacteriia bacterium]
MIHSEPQYRVKRLLDFVKESFSSEHKDFTTGSLRKAIFLLAIPMMLEMGMESVFAIVDIFFVSKLGPRAIATVGLTESAMAIIYSIAFGLGMAVTAMVARRVGEKKYEEASRSGAQSIVLALGVSILISITGFFFAEKILLLLGASAATASYGFTFTKILLTGNMVIMLLHLMNGIFRGAGDAAIAMKSLWVANLCNIIFCPLFIQVFGWGIQGAAIATTTGRGIGVCYQLYHLLKGKGIIKMHVKYFIPVISILKSLLNVAVTATLQFIVASASWIAMARIMASFGDKAVSGYTIAIRLLIFFIMPAFGLSNAAATLVGQNLGAQQPERAALSVWKVAKYNAVFMAFVSVLFFFTADFFIGLIASDSETMQTGVKALRIISLGYVFFGIGMVLMNAFNGAGDSRTPTWINLFWFWLFQIPLAYATAIVLHWGPVGVFVAIVVTETLVTITSAIIFQRGKWKLVKI